MDRRRAHPYPGVLAAQGGPVAAFEHARLEVLRRPLHHVNVRLVDGLIPRPSDALFADAAGSGTHAQRVTAEAIAVSEAMERWAYHVTARSARAREYAFDVDPTSNGFAAYPGANAVAARCAALREAVERFSLLAWWEGTAEARPVHSDWPELEAFVIEGPMGGVTVLAVSERGAGGRAYGHAAAPTFGEAFERAAREVARNRIVLAEFARVGRFAGGALGPVERRMLFFASETGYGLVKERVAASAGRRMAMPVLACDSELTGPWSRYATVWRTVFLPPGKRFLAPGDDYFYF